MAPPLQVAGVVGAKACVHAASSQVANINSMWLMHQIFSWFDSRHSYYNDTLTAATGSVVQFHHSLLDEGSVRE
jgi:hypothetical protein